MSGDSKPFVKSTSYDRSACQVGIVHLGFGAFHRAHQAVYVDDYMDVTGDLSWGIAAVNLRASEASSFASFDVSNDGYFLKSIAPNGDVEYRKVRSHIASYDWSSAADKAEALLAQPNVHAVSITVTESGYYLDNTGGLNPSDPTIVREMAGEAKHSVYAYLMSALQLRMNAGGAPITILCCDNIRQNGKMLKANFLSYLSLAGNSALLDWVKANATFPCSMVDRITPRATQELSTQMQALFGAAAANPIMAEAFVQWVVEASFAGPMPDLTKVGVTVTDDVDPYEEAKIRILNGGHTCLTYLAALSGVVTFDQAMHDPTLYDHFHNYEVNEVLPALTIKLPFDKAAYLQSIAERFGNAAIGDTVERICADGVAKFPIFVRPTLAGCLAQGRLPVYGLRSVASWYVFAKHMAAGKLKIAYNEPSWDFLQELLKPEQLDAFVSSNLLWDDLPAQYPEFIPALKAEITELETKWPV